MIRIRKAADRGHTDHDWLKSHHTFSFADYQDPMHMHFRSLRVLNEDVIAAGKGFPMHSHANMEIFTLVLGGTVQHEDSLGNRETLSAGQFQRITAGTGIAHSESNPSRFEAVRFYQIWMFPSVQDLKPSFEKIDLGDSADARQARLIASPDGRDGSLTVHQDASIFLVDVDSGRSWTQPVVGGRHVWIQSLSGTIDVLGKPMSPGDGAAITAETEVEIRADRPAKIMLFDLA